MPGHSRCISASIRAPPTSSGITSSTARSASSRSARTSQTSSPVAGTTFSASPLLRIVGTAVSRSGPCGSWQPATVTATWASATRAFTPLSGAEPEWAARPCARTPDAARRLAADDDGVVAVRVVLAGLEAQARVEAREARAVQERATSATPRRSRAAAPPPRAPGSSRQRAQHAERQRDAGLHVDRARPAHERPGRAAAARARRGGRRCRGARRAARGARPSRSRAGAGPARARPRSTAGASTSASSGASAVATATTSSAATGSPDGEETATSASRSRSARAARPAACSSIQGSMRSVLLQLWPRDRRWATTPRTSSCRARRGPSGSPTIAGSASCSSSTPGTTRPVCTKQFCSYRDRADDMSRARRDGRRHLPPGRRLARGVHGARTG